MKRNPLLIAGALLIATSLSTSSCSNDDDKTPEEVIVPGPPAEIDTEIDGFKVVSYGKGVVTKLEQYVEGNSIDFLWFDKLFPDAVQLYAPPLSWTEEEVPTNPALVKNRYPANMPITVFFRDNTTAQGISKLYLNSLAGNIEVKADGVDVKGSLIFNEDDRKNAYLTFTPFVPFEANQTIFFHVKYGLKNQYGTGTNGYPQTKGTGFTLEYKTLPPSTTAFDKNQWGFENGSEGAKFVGDGTILNTPIGELKAKTGNGYAVMSTSDSYEQGIIVEGKYSDNSIASSITMGPINENINKINFDYNFISAEYGYPVNSETIQFNDYVIMVVSGPRGSYSEIVTSIERERAGEITEIKNVLQTPYCGQSGWKNRTINFGSVGSPAYVTFIIKDTGNNSVTSALALDNISF